VNQETDGAAHGNLITLKGVTPRLLRTLALLAPIPFFYSAPLFAADPHVCEKQMEKASVRYGVPLGVLYAVGMTETGRKGSLHPYALNVEGKTVYASTAQEALAVFRQSRLQGVKLIDLGCMQINHYYHAKAFASVNEMLEPRVNVAYAAKFLKQLHASEGSWTMAVARYHAGPNNNPAQKRYVCEVITNLVASGFGAWTPEARTFCK
jgi:soluble lytic murein transglycosylase-like protein